MKTNHEKHAVDEVKRQQYLKIKAKSIEYISDNGYGAGINYTTNIVVDIMTGFAFDEVTAATEELRKRIEELTEALAEQKRIYFETWDRLQ